MTQAYPMISSGDICDHENVPVGVAKWLCLAAAPTFAIMAVLTGLLDGGPDVLCSAGHDSPLTGMVAMYSLMSVFHLAPWLTLASNTLRGYPRSSLG
jgi:hypothetical protein